jgi:uncharacterized protein YjbI with pentapeptide repeats
MKRSAVIARLHRRFQRSGSSKHPRRQASTVAKLEAEKRADDLNAIQKAVEDAATVSAGIWLSYLFVLFYLSIAAAAVTHTDLLLENPVKLPFLNIELPLVFFFVLSPALFIIVHAYTLVHFVFLGRKAARFHEALYVMFPDRSPPDIRDGVNSHNATIREGLRSQLPSNVFVQILAGPSEVRRKHFGRLLRLISLFTLVLGPIGTLLLFEIRFLPYHDGFTTWLHRCAIVLDMALVLWLWPLIVGYQNAQGLDRTAKIRASIVTAALAALVVIFSFGIATFPGERIERSLPTFAFIPTKWTNPSVNSFRARELLFNWAKSLALKSPYELLFSGPVDQTTRRRSSVFSNTLILPDFDIYNALKIDEPTKIQWKDSILSLRGRHLEGAVLNNARLYKVDFTNAHMEKASLTGARLPGAVLVGTNLQGAELSVAHLEGADLGAAHLEGAILIHTSFQGSSLSHAWLQGAVLFETHFQGANLRGAQLQATASQIDPSANLIAGPDFTAALLSEAQLQGAELVNANFTAAELAGARVWRTLLDQSKSPNANCQDLDFRPIVAGVEGEKETTWDQTAYLKFATQLSSGITFEDTKKRVIDAISRLDCETSELNKIEPFSCASGGKIPARIEQVQRDFKKHCKTNMTAYLSTAIHQLKQIICDGREEAIYVLRGLLGSPLIAGEMFEKPSNESANLMAFVASKKCPVNAFLTDRDKSEMQFIISRANKRG